MAVRILVEAGAGKWKEATPFSIGWFAGIQYITRRDDLSLDEFIEEFRRLWEEQMQGIPDDDGFDDTDADDQPIEPIL